MIISDGPDGFSCFAAGKEAIERLDDAANMKRGQLLAPPRDALRLSHVLTTAELAQVNKCLREHGVPTFTQPCHTADLLGRVRWLDKDHSAHVLRELEAALSGGTGGGQYEQP